MRDPANDPKSTASAAPAAKRGRKKRRVMIALEGIDGSGKSVQFARLKARLEAAGKRVGVLDFPCYDSFFGGQIGVFLSGSGSVSAADVDVRSMSLWYAMDRVKAFEQFDPAAYDVILLNRSTMANAAYQGSRVQLEAKKRGEDPQTALETYIKWLFELEFDVLGVPKPDIFFVFDVPVSVSRANVAKKGRRDYVGGEKADVYEKDNELLETVRKGYLTCAEMFGGVTVIPCTGADNAMRGIDEISGDVWAALSGLIK